MSLVKPPGKPSYAAAPDAARRAETRAITTRRPQEEVKIFSDTAAIHWRAAGNRPEMILRPQYQRLVKAIKICVGLVDDSRHAGSQPLRAGGSRRRNLSNRSDVSGTDVSKRFSVGQARISCG